MAMLTVLASTLVACGLVSIAGLKGRLGILETDSGIAALAGLGMWFSFTLVFYAHYNTPFLGIVWYPVSVAVALWATAFLFAKLRLKRPHSV